MRPQGMGLISIKLKDWWNQNALILLFLVVLSIQLPILSGPILYYSNIELFLLAMVAVFLGKINMLQVKSAGRILLADPIFWLLSVWSVWSLVVWTAQANWAYGVNETRWIFLSVVAYAVLRILFIQQWEQKTKAVIIVCIVIAIFPDGEGLLRLFSAPLPGVSLSSILLPGAGSLLQKEALGFFRHPNEFGGFVFWPLLLSFGLVDGRRTRLAGVLAVLFLGISLFLSGYRSLMLGAGMALVLIFLQRINLTPRKWMVLFIGLTICGILLFLSMYYFFLTSPIFKTLTGRIILWIEVAPIILFSGNTILFGSGVSMPLTIPNGMAITDPHNAFLYLLVHYGFPGLYVYLLMISVVFWRGWRLYRAGLFRANLLAGSLWVGFIVWFITSMTDSRLTNPEWQFQFVLFLAIFMAFPFSADEGIAIREQINSIE
jgi:hypothetical protein